MTTPDIEDIFTKPCANRHATMFLASRRTDPCHQMPKIVDFLLTRKTSYLNPMTSQPVPVINVDAHGFGLASKDFSTFLSAYRTHPELARDYCFHFTPTMNGTMRDLESGVASSWIERLEHLRQICTIAEKQCLGHVNYSVSVHYGDPFIRLRKIGDTNTFDTYHLDELKQLCDILTEFVLNTLHFGFCDASGGWSHVRKRLTKNGYELVDMNTEEKFAYLQPILTFLDTNYPAIRLATCANIELVPLHRRIHQGTCFNGNLFNRVLRANGFTSIQTKQRGVKNRPCTCTHFIDILDKPRKATRCAHNCTYCFSNPI